jgi:hypothetical protein
MTKWKLAALGGLVAALIRHEFKQRAIIMHLHGTNEVLIEHLDDHLQEKVDAEFEDIVDTYED